MNKLIFILLSLCACAKSNHQDGPKVFRDVWVSPSDPAWTIDLTGDTVKWYYLSGGSCESTVLASFSDTDGQMILSNSSALVMVSGMPNCSQFDGTWTYGIANGILSLCLQGSPCVEFR